MSHQVPAGRKCHFAAFAIIGFIFELSDLTDCLDRHRTWLGCKIFADGFYLTGGLWPHFGTVFLESTSGLECTLLCPGNFARFQVFSFSQSCCYSWLH